MTTKILLIDDDIIVAEFLKKILSVSQLDIVVETHHDVNPSLHYFKPDVIISDVQLHSTSEEETVSSVRTYFPETPLIVISSAEPKNIGQWKQQYNIAQFISKETLPSAIEEALIGVIKTLA